MQERLADEQHQLEKQKLDQSAELIPYQIGALKAETDLRTEHAKAYSEDRATEAQQKVKFNRQRQALVNEVNDQSGRLKLNDVQFATKDPVSYAANVMKFKDMFELSPLPEVKNAIRQYQTIADQQKITLRAAVKGEDGNWAAIGESKQVPIWQVVKRLQDPATHEEAVSQLRVSGHIQSQESRVKNPKASWWDKHIPWEDDTMSVTKDVPDATAQGLMDKTSTDFGHVPSKVPPAMLPSSASSGTSPTGMTGYAPTETDGVIARAKSAIARGASRDAVVKKLDDMGIDSTLLDEP